MIKINVISLATVPIVNNTQILDLFGVTKLHIIFTNLNNLVINGAVLINSAALGDVSVITIGDGINQINDRLDFNGSTGSDVSFIMEVLQNY